MGFDVEECLEFTEHSPVQQAFRTLLFSRIVPCVKDIGLWGPKVQRAYTDLGVIDAADSDLEALMRDDEEIAERVDEREVRGRAGRPPGRGRCRDGRRRQHRLRKPSALARQAVRYDSMEDPHVAGHADLP